MPLLVEPHLPAGSLNRRPQPTLDLGDLVARPWSGTDVDAVFEAYADAAIQQWHARTMTPAEADDWIVRWTSEWSAETGASWAIEADRVVVGQVGLRLIDLAGGTAHISYWVRPEARGHGYAPRALAAVTAWSLGELGLHRLELNHATGNEASCRVATKAGYAAEGIKRSQALHADGWHDMHTHARLTV
jgi:RimJ/RimL family protein N-acetyltransferase